MVLSFLKSCGGDEIINVLEYLEHSAERFPSKIAVQDMTASSSYYKLSKDARSIGSRIAASQASGKPVVVFMEKSVEALTSFLGVVYAGCFYVFISPEQPAARIQQVLEVVHASCILTLTCYNEQLEALGFRGEILLYEEAVLSRIDTVLLHNIRCAARDIDPLYCNFTSGSTGVPKGVLVSHRSVIDFMNYFPDMFCISPEDRIANQAPFDFDVSVKDIYSSLKVGATLVIVPKKLFSVLTELLDYLCDNHITTMIWAVSALCLISQLKGLTYRIPTAVDKILFSGEAMPVKHLNLWRQALPNARFVNLYGPTEITCNCTYYEVQRSFSPEEKLPIGIPFPNERVFLLDEENQEITQVNQSGELCVSGTALALGYYNNPEQTKAAFVQNPLNPYYPETIYRTGDLAFYNEAGELCFAGRKDFQVKHMGHRIELEEVEAVLSSFPGLQRACCAYDGERKKIIAFYVGVMDKKEIQLRLQGLLPVFMIPNVYLPMPEFPLTANGKIDRKQLFALYKGGRK